MFFHTWGNRGAVACPSVVARRIKQWHALVIAFLMTRVFPVADSDGALALINVRPPDATDFFNPHRGRDRETGHASGGNALAGSAVEKRRPCPGDAGQRGRRTTPRPCAWRSAVHAGAVGSRHQWRVRPRALTPALRFSEGRTLRHKRLFDEPGRAKRPI